MRLIDGHFNPFFVQSMTLIDFEIFLISVDQEMIIPEWLFELPIIKPERTEF